MKYDSDEITRRAKIHYNDPTPFNAGQVIISLEKIVCWQIKKVGNAVRASHAEEDDLKQEAAIGIMRALEKYDGEREFLPYVSLWIKQKIHRHISQEYNIVKYPKGMKEMALRYNYTRLMKEGLKENPRATEVELHEYVAKEIGCNLESVEAHKCKTMGVMSLDATTKTHDWDGKHTLSDTTTNDPNYEDNTNSEIDRKKCLRVIKTIGAGMKPRDREILHEYVAGDGTVTLQELGDRHGITRERVRQISDRVRDRVLFWAKQEMRETLI